MFASAKIWLRDRRRARLEARAVRAEWDLAIGDRLGRVRSHIWEHDAMPRDELVGGGFAGPNTPPDAWSRRG